MQRGIGSSAAATTGTRSSSSSGNSNNHAPTESDSKKEELRREVLEKPSNRGISNPVYAGLRTTFDGFTSLKLVITPDVMRSIFREFPYVKKVYNESVPKKCTEVAFWTVFFQSEYFYKIRSSGQEVRTGSADSSARNLFQEYPRESRIDVFSSDKLVRPSALGALDNLARDTESVTAGSVPEVATAVNSQLKHDVDTIMRKYNKHSAAILGASLQDKGTVPLLAPVPAEISVERSVFLQDLAHATETRNVVQIPLNAPDAYFRDAGNDRENDDGKEDASVFLPVSSTPGCSAEMFLRDSQQTLSLFSSDVARQYKHEQQRQHEDTSSAQVPVSDKDMKPLFHRAVVLSRHLWSCYPLGRKQRVRPSRKVRELLDLIENERRVIEDRLPLVKSDAERYHYERILCILNRARDKAVDTVCSSEPQEPQDSMYDVRQ